MKKITEILAKIKRYSYSLCILPFTKKVNRRNFKSIYQKMRDLYIINKDQYNFSEFVVPQWKQNVDEIEYYFLNKFSFFFLNNKTIKATMFIYTFKKWKDIQKKLITEYFTKKVASNLLHEYNLGIPLLNDIEYITSANNIHILYHLTKFLKETKTNAQNFNSVVEVGGGYGAMAKIFKQINKSSTYIIIDLPIFSYIQAVYLKTIFGDDKIHIVHGKDIYIKKGYINLIPLDKNNLVEINKSIGDTSLFISTWALSESNLAMQNYIKESRYFNSQYLLLAYQKSVEAFAFAENVKDVSKMYDIVYDKETEYIKDNYYLFCVNNSNSDKDHEKNY